MDQGLLPCILLALAATSLDNLGQGLQKAGSEWMPGGRHGLRERTNQRRLAVWLAGILLCAAAPVTLAMALVAGPSSLVAALGAFGLVPLYLFAHCVLKEPITKAHLVALATLVAGALLVPIAVAPLAFREPVEAWLLAGLGLILFGIGALAWGERISSPGSPDPVPPAPAPSGSGRGATGSSAA